jgi:hypothetical protein
MLLAIRHSFIPKLLLLRNFSRSVMYLFEIFAFRTLIFRDINFSGFYFFEVLFFEIIAFEIFAFEILSTYQAGLTYRKNKKCSILYLIEITTTLSYRQWYENKFYNILIFTKIPDFFLDFVLPIFLISTHRLLRGLKERK